MRSSNLRRSNDGIGLGSALGGTLEPSWAVEADRLVRFRVDCGGGPSRLGWNLNSLALVVFCDALSIILCAELNELSSYNKILISYRVHIIDYLHGGCMEGYEHYSVQYITYINDKRMKLGKNFDVTIL